MAKFRVSANLRMLCGVSLALHRIPRNAISFAWSFISFPRRFSYFQVVPHRSLMKNITTGFFSLNCARAICEASGFSPSLVSCITSFSLKSDTGLSMVALLGGPVWANTRPDIAISPNNAVVLVFIAPPGLNSRSQIGPTRRSIGGFERLVYRIDCNYPDMLPQRVGNQPHVLRS